MTGVVLRRARAGDAEAIARIHVETWRATYAGLLPDRHQHIIRFLEQWGFVILLGLLVTGAVRLFLIPALWVNQTVISLVAENGRDPKSGNGSAEEMKK